MKSPFNRGGLRFYLVAIALVAGTLVFNATTPRSILAGLPFLVVGVCLHTWAKGCLRQNRLVARIGPYRYVRHPFYLANALIDAGLVVMCNWLPLAVALTLWWLAIYIPVIRGEEKFLSEKFPEEYPDYRRRVPCLIPWRWPLPRAGEGFRWDNPNIAGGEELPRAVRILAYPLLFFVAHGVRNSGFDWLRDGWNLTGLSGLLALYAIAWQLHRHQRQRRFIVPAAMRHPLLRLLVSAAILAGVYSIQTVQTCYQNVLPIGGAVMLLLSVPIYARRPVRAMLAEMLALLGAIAAAELLWLAPPVTALYQAWILDRQLAARDLTENVGDAGATTWWPYLYPLLAAGCAAVIGIKLVGRVLPYHFAGL